MPTLAELIDRLSIVTLKSVFIPENKPAYDQEAKDICHDIDLLLKNAKLDANALRAAMIVMLANRYIWENESKCRQGQSQDLHLLKITHSINGVRNTAKNVISQVTGERKDLKIDCLAADVVNQQQNWRLFE